MYSHICKHMVEMDRIDPIVLLDYFRALKKIYWRILGQFFLLLEHFSAILEHFWALKQPKSEYSMHFRALTIPLAHYIFLIFNSLKLISKTLNGPSLNNLAP